MPLFEEKRSTPDVAPAVHRKRSDLPLWAKRNPGEEARRRYAQRCGIENPGESNEFGPQARSDLKAGKRRRISKRRGRRGPARESGRELAQPANLVRRRVIADGWPKRSIVSRAGSR